MSASSAAGVLDLTLDDVIKQRRTPGTPKAKSGGKGRNKGSGKGGGKQKQGKSKKAQVVSKKVRRNKALSKKEIRSKVARTQRPASVFGAAVAGVAGTLGSRQAKNNSTPKSNGPVTHAKDKLTMSLDDVIKGEVRQARPKKKSAAAEIAAKKNLKGKQGARIRMGLRKNDTKRRAVGNANNAPNKKAGKGARKGTSKGKGKRDRGYDDWSKGNSKGKRSKGKGKGGRPRERQSSMSWDDSSWEVSRDAGRKRRMYDEDDYAPRNRQVMSDRSWSRVDDRKGGGKGSSSMGKGRDDYGKGSSRSVSMRDDRKGSGKGIWEDSRPRAEERRRERERLDDRDRSWASSGLPSRSIGWNPVARERISSARESLVPKSRPSGAPRGSHIRVSNVPKNLDWRDIKEAFEDTGKVLRCDVERGVAMVEFANPKDAEKAVQTFDRGELNGQTIFVTLESPR